MQLKVNIPFTEWDFGYYFFTAPGEAAPLLVLLRNILFSCVAADVDSA